MTITYEAKPVSQVPAELLRDMNEAGLEWATVRTREFPGKPTLAQVWSLHANEKLAVAACRRHRARDIVTR
jgi:hypothetical protein